MAILKKILAFVKLPLGGPAAAPAARASAPDQVESLHFARHVELHHGFPIVDWKAVQAWLDALAPERRAGAWQACERAWLLRFRDALGAEFRLDENASAALVSSLEPRLARATLEFMSRTLRRIGAVLEGLAQPYEWGKDILIVFPDDEAYYRYVSYYYPESGEFAFSGGMHINWGCGHFVTAAKDLRQIEPTIAHEMTHACLAHLPLPTWLNEGLAVNVEHRLTGRVPGLATPEQMHRKHQRFWSSGAIQAFWSGTSFRRPGESNSLSYDLARILVEQLAKDWAPFRRFVLAADRDDGGAAAARAELGVDLGEIVVALLAKQGRQSWAPRPQTWKEADEALRPAG